MQFAENWWTFVQKAQILSIQSTRDGWFPRRKTVARLLGVTASLPVRADGCPVDADAAWPRPRRAGASWMRAAWATPRQVGPPSRGSRRAAREPQVRGWARNCPCCSSRGGRGAPPGRAWTPELCARSRADHVGLEGPRARPREGRSVVRDRGTPDACGGPPRSCEPKPRGPSAVATQGRMRVAEAPGRRSPIRGRAGHSGR